MKNNDLSCRGSYCIGVDFFTLFSAKENNFFEKLINKKRLVINKEVFSLIEYIYFKSDFRVNIYISSEELSKLERELKNDYPFIHELIHIGGISKISRDLLLGNMTYYIVDDDYKKSLINNKNAIYFKDIKNYIKR